MRVFLFLTFIIFLSCNSSKEDYILVYFDNGIIDDAPFGLPKFSAIEREHHEMIYQLEDGEIDGYLYLNLQKVVKNGVNNRKDRELADSSAKIEAVYLQLKNPDITFFFNSFDDFYDSENKFLFRDEGLANSIRNLINYKNVIMYGVDSDVPQPLYYKILLKIKR